MAKINAGDRNAVGGADSARASRITRGAATRAKSTVQNQTKSKADAPGGVQKGGGSLNYKETSAHKQANKSKFDANSKKDWKGVAKSLSIGGYHPLEIASGEATIKEGPGFLKREAKAVGRGFQAMPEFTSAAMDLKMHPDKAFGITGDGDKVIDPYFNSDPFTDIAEPGLDVADGALAATTFTGIGGLAKSLAGRAARSAGPEISEIAQGLSRVPPSHKLRMIDESVRPRPIPHTAPQQATANVYTGPAHDLERGIFDPTDQGVYPMGHAGDRTGWHPSDEMGGWYQ